MTSNNILQPFSPKTRYLVYQIKNLINNKIYVGAHACSCKSCSYMGSGKELKKEYRKIGKENFKKEILFEFNNKEEMLVKEREIVNEIFIKRSDVYNMIIGGGDLTTIGKIVVKNEHNESMLININDERFLNGELVGIMKGRVSVRDKEGNTFSVFKNDPRYISGELISINTGILRNDKFKKRRSEAASNTSWYTNIKTGKKFMLKPEDPRTKMEDFVLGRFSIEEKKQISLKLKGKITNTIRALNLSTNKVNFVSIFEIEEKIKNKEYSVNTKKGLYKINMMKKKGYNKI